MVNGYGYMPYYLPVYGGAWQQLIDQWTQLGVFTILLPLILVFTVVFAILERVNLFRNRGVHVLIALVIGFFTIGNPYVSGFFMYLFPNLGIGIAILIVLVVLISLAVKPGDKAWPWILGVAGGIIFLVIMAKSGLLSSVFGPGAWSWVYLNQGLVIIVLFIALAIVSVIVGVKSEKEPSGKIYPT